MFRTAGDLFVGKAFGHFTQDDQFARRERFISVSLGELCLDFRRNPTLPGGDGANCGNKIFIG